MTNLLEEKVRVSYGTAIVLGLIEARHDVAPTTAYLLWDTGCIGSCSFCPRANGNSQTKRLSRIIWPEFSFSQIVSLLSAEPRPFRRVCLQTGFNPEKNETLKEFAGILSNKGMNFSVTLSPSQTKLASELLEIGADHIGIGLDGASPGTYLTHKKKNWETDWPGLLELIRANPGRIEVHLIFGLGDSEEQFCSTISEITMNGGQVSLFALTPVNGGTAPDLSSYRRVQIFRYLNEIKGIKFEDFGFLEGKLTQIKHPFDFVLQLLDQGTCFRTSGCGDCNRPYYNERPGQIFYNFPRPLTPEEFKEALETAEIQTSG
ncbi:MAG: radical SAM protein [Candidatus Rifleibacteriota bacterium]